MAKPNSPSEHNSRLGKGLSALMADSAQVSSQSGTYAPVPETHQVTPQAEVARPAMPRQVPLSQISANPYQPRRHFAEAALAELADSVAKQGILQPLLVCRSAEGAGENHEYVLIAGERRLRAAQLAGLAEVPCVVRQASAREMLEWSLVENIQRADLGPIERARGYQEYMDRFSLTQTEVAERLGEPRPTVANYVRMLDLPQEVQGMLADGELSFGHGKVLAGLTGQTELQVSLAKEVVEKKLSVRQIEELAEKAKQKAGRGNTGKLPEGGVGSGKPAYVVDLEGRLSEATGTRVSIVTGKSREKGRIVVEYYSLEDFDRIAGKLGLTGA